MTFKEWLKTATKKDGSLLSKSSINHYLSGFETVSREMFNAKVINKKLEEMELYELDLAIAIILKNNNFTIKDEKGKRMYSNSLKRFRCYKYLNSDKGIQEEVEESSIINDTSLTAREKETIIKARRGQGIYRDKLLEKYNKTCIMTKVSLVQVLIASHIKPWVVCDNFEKVDVNNGLLLSATYDRLFDSGLISFDQKGRLKVSSLISKDNANKLKIKNGLNYDIKYNPDMWKYIEYHNDYIFVK